MRDAPSLPAIRFRPISNLFKTGSLRAIGCIELRISTPKDILLWVQRAEKIEGFSLKKTSAHTVCIFDIEFISGGL